MGFIATLATVITTIVTALTTVVTFIKRLLQHRNSRLFIAISMKQTPMLLREYPDYSSYLSAVASNKTGVICVRCRAKSWSARLCDFIVSDEITGLKVISSSELDYLADILSGFEHEVHSEQRNN